MSPILAEVPGSRKWVDALVSRDLEVRQVGRQVELDPVARYASAFLIFATFAFA
jgi:hypothetical protein